jgi:hypothetical protein
MEWADFSSIEKKILEALYLKKRDIEAGKTLDEMTLSLLAKKIDYDIDSILERKTFTEILLKLHQEEFIQLGERTFEGISPISTVSQKQFH